MQQDIPTGERPDIWRKIRTILNEAEAPGADRRVCALAAASVTLAVCVLAHMVHERVRPFRDDTPAVFFCMAETAAGAAPCVALAASARPPKPRPRP